MHQYKGNRNWSKMLAKSKQIGHRNPSKSGDKSTKVSLLNTLSAEKCVGGLPLTSLPAVFGIKSLILVTGNNS